MVRTHYPPEDANKMLCSAQNVFPMFTRHTLAVFVPLRKCEWVMNGNSSMVALWLYPGMAVESRIFLW